MKDSERGRQGDKGTGRQGDKGNSPPLPIVSLSPCLPVPLSPCPPVPLSLLFLPLREDHPPLIEIPFDDDRFVWFDFAVEQFHGERVLDQVLDRAFQRTRAVNRIEPFSPQRRFFRLTSRQLQ